MMARARRKKESEEEDEDEEEDDEDEEEYEEEEKICTRTATTQKWGEDTVSSRAVNYENTPCGSAEKPTDRGMGPVTYSADATCGTPGVRCARPQMPGDAPVCEVSSLKMI